MIGKEGVSMSSIPTVSIGMPVFNNVNTISEAIDMILNQSLTDFELIISDNCSTDGTEYICRTYAKKDPRIRYIRQDVNIGSDRNSECLGALTLKFVSFPSLLLRIKKDIAAAL